MIRRSLWLICAVLVAVVYTSAQEQVCTLRTAHGVHGSWFQIAAFELQNDSTEVTRSFHHKESATDISVRVDIYPSRGTKQFKDLGKIQIAISLALGPEAEAETAYDQRWKWLSVQNDIKVGGEIYTFSFGCAKMKKEIARTVLSLKTE